MLVKESNQLSVKSLEGIRANWTKISPLDKQKIVKLLSSSERYEDTHPIECYEPQDYQFSFHNARPIDRILASFSANQTGKTYGAKFHTAFHFTGNYPEWYTGFRCTQPSVGRILVKDFPKAVGEVIEPALKSALPPGAVRKWKRNSQGFITKITGNNGSSIDIVTHDMDTKSLEGWQGNYLWCDEPPPRDKWIACQRGLIRRNGFSYLSCTPLDEPWIYDEIYLNKNCFTITVDITQNKYLTKEAVDRFASQLNEDEKEARLHGRFMHLSGLVYKEFNSSTHIVESLPSDSGSWPIWQVVDPHTRKPFAIIYFKVDPLGRVWIYNEWPHGNFNSMKNSSSTPQDYANIFREMEVGKKVYRRIMDGRFCKQPQGAGGDSLLQIFDKLDVHFEPSYITMRLGTADPGHLKLKEKLRVSPVTGKPDMFILSNCTNVIYSFQHNVWENYRSETQGIKEKPAEYGKDFLDCIRYGMMDDPIYIVENNDLVKRSSWVENREMQGTYGSE